MTLDNVTLRVFANHCRAAAESMAYTLIRTAYSAFVKESQDFTSTLITPDGQTFTYHQDTGVTWMVGVDYGDILSRIPVYEEGDICITNDPYSGFVCTHLPDLYIWKPVFHEGVLVCFAAGFIHNTDVGGAYPASMSRLNTEVFQEGIRVPPKKLLRRGKLNEDVYDILMANVRIPEQNWGDLKAQIASLNTGERKVHELIAKFGLDTFRAGMYQLIDHAERQARDLIRRMPDGVYEFSDFVDEDSEGGLPVRVAARMTVRGDELELDFTGSDPQLASALNVPTGGKERHWIIMVAFFTAFYSLDPTLLLNIGVTRPIRALLPEGSVLNPHFPAAVASRTMPATRLQDVIFGLLSLALPEHMPAAPAGTVIILNAATTDERTGKRVVAAINPVYGGGGGMPFADGPNGAGGNNSFLQNTPIEITEAETPIRVLRYALECDSAGAGTYRGGLATNMEIQVFSPGTVTARNKDRSHFQSWGVLGGRPAKPARYLLNADSPHEQNTGNTDIIRVEPGDRVRVVSSAGGGWGSPLERDPERVLRDVRHGFVSVVAASHEYGVVIREGRIDVPETERLRQRLAREAPCGHFDFGPLREEYERVWTPANYQALTEILAGIPAHWRFFVKHKIFAVVAAQPQDQDDRVRQAYARVRQEFAIPQGKSL